jgi:nuclear receptor interaction protein
MMGSVEDRIFRRELGNSTSRYTKPRGLYGAKSFIQELDIINELNGHTGCVNALSWSKSGRLLASGSDDRVINIYSYLPQYTNNQFDLATQIDTGHTRNIFSVKFMPHSNDRTIVSAAGDAQIRVFDIERSGVLNGTKARLSQGQANCKVFQSHSAAAKRIVTEASPFYFLSCAEDGDVRQWDVRQPESAYPRSANRFYTARHGRSKGDAPPPLISYADYNIDLMSISCSPSQPHYIALGGTALHCFLHDRRMLGRDRLKERGSMPMDEHELAEATRCVRKFAPYGQPKMRRSDPKSITAVKISDNNPNELIASWNGDFIYSFDITRDDDSFTGHPGFSKGTASGRIKRRDRKRKRNDASTTALSQLGENRGGSRQRTQRDESQERQEISLVIQMEGGENVEIPLPRRAFPEARITRAQPSQRSEGETIAQQVRQVRNTLFVNSLSPPDVQVDEQVSLRSRMDQALSTGLMLLEKIDKLIAEWAYPMTESRSQIAFQQKLREDRAKTWRFVQACGTIARVASRRPAATSPRRLLELFDIIKPAPRESSMSLERHEHFGYDFTKTVLLWLESGVGAVLREFTHDPDSPNTSYRKRRPVSLNADIDAIDIELIPYLQRLASENAVDDLDDNTGQGYIFRTEVDAVNSLARAMRIPFADLAGHAAERDGTGTALTQDRETAVKFWAYRVCRAVLKNAAIDVTYSLVDTAFGEFMGASYAQGSETLTSQSTNATAIREENDDDDEDESDGNDDDDDDDDDADVMAEDSSEGDSDSDSETDEDYGENQATFLLGNHRSPRSKMTAGKHVPCITHTNHYQGHCNVETTKDVNFFGLQDEYVISGSDCGHLFIWDKKTTKLLNILEGDNEVVNVIQGHPYEPMIAVSGIDSTVKVFGIDARARKDAAMGVGIEQVDRSRFSSIGLRGRRDRQRRQRDRLADEETQRQQQMPDSAFDLPEQLPPTNTITSEPAAPHRNTAEQEDDDAEPLWYELESSITDKGGLTSRKRMHDEYQIVSRNDMDRRRGARQGGFITRGMLAMLAQHMGVQHSGDGEEGDEDGEVDPEGCAVM